MVGDDVYQVRSPRRSRYHQRQDDPIRFSYPRDGIIIAHELPQHLQAFHRPSPQDEQMDVQAPPQIV